jgi:hypothetical protein
MASLPTTWNLDVLRADSPVAVSPLLADPNTGAADADQQRLAREFLVHAGAQFEIVQFGGHASAAVVEHAGARDRPALVREDGCDGPVRSVAPAEEGSTRPAAR